MAFAGYRVNIKHCWLDGTPVKMYFIENTPFTYDPLTRDQREDRWILFECALNPEFTQEQILKNSEYLLEEEIHPLLFDVPVITVETMPDEKF
tara:strand:- start:110 stop:388 length:279 start_codon:yes stop_codon:yes gene_type:complete